MKIENCNLMVYVKIKENKNFKALQSLKEFTFAPNLMYACLIPYDKIDTLKEWADNFKDLCKQEEVSIEIRSTYKNKCLYRIN
jgi:hypothetical protein